MNHSLPCLEEMVTIDPRAPGPQVLTLTDPDGETVSLDAALTAN